MTAKNFNLAQMPSDYLYHLAVNIADTKNTADIRKKYGHIKVVCLGGKDTRMRELAKYIHENVYDGNSGSDYQKDLFEEGHRYAGFMVGSVLCVSHGVGSSTMSVVLHELIKLVHYAGCDDPLFIRIGTSGGLGVSPGTVVVTNKGYNGLLRSEYEIAILGERVVRPAYFDDRLRKDLLACAEAVDGEAEKIWKVIEGNTMGAECFYEGQGRLDGASCTKVNGERYTLEDKLNFLKRCHDECGIKNIEMEAPMFASLTLHCGIRAADVCVTLLNRLEGDQVKATKAQLKDFEERPFVLVARFIKRHILSST
ncbi:uridine phosphorylase 1 isoform X2 [Anastrepha obliqua]|nr:uridine phosphorylase 1 isoform X2 [Anastrepha obliqua]XP_054726602.1 uridine phosphorylase 1 isoform X2 [Anastrepha obliqua]XP_054726604.1 uridine phosphorylase 1 isoform X2 [Anastrepha obliqua]